MAIKIRIPPDINPLQSLNATAIFAGADKDWRVRLGIPSNMLAYQRSLFNDVLAPLRQTNNSLVFPYTPTIFMTHTANYDKLSPTHSNYPFPIYQNSQVDQFVITGEFTAENEIEGRYVIAAMHFLRSITKMAYGQSSDAGAPPPVLKLNGYGDYIFKDVPVVVEQAQFNLANDVDYIRVPDIVSPIIEFENFPFSRGKKGSWVPTSLEISVGVSPAYSRNAVNKFSLDKFVRGEYLKDPKSPGYI